MASSLLSEITFGSFYVYSPRGEGAVSKQSRSIVRDGVKNWRLPVARKLVERVAAEYEEAGLDAVLGPSTTLVPAPRSSPRIAGALWPAASLCETLVEPGLGAEWVPTVERSTRVPKSAFARPGERPDASIHYTSLKSEPGLITGDRLAVVDDIVTRGDTLLAACSRLAEWSDLPVCGFALVRTMGFVPDVEALIAPCVGTIRRSGSGANRSP